MTHLLVTNDFPPKVGGIQSYLWELWRRLPPDRVTVLTTRYPGAAEFDDAQPFAVRRSRARVLLPTPALAHQIDDLADEIGAGVVVLDPALPLGLVGPRLRHRFALVLHGAEVTVPARLPGSASLLRHVLRAAVHVIAAGDYPAREARRLAGDDAPVTVVAPGVDVERFRPLTPDERRDARVRLGLPCDAPCVVSVSRLVPRKGMDVLVRAASWLLPRHPGLTLAIAGDGRDRPRLERLVRRVEAPVRFLGRVDDRSLPAVYGCADVFAVLCRTRWGGLEQEGFGVVFLEAAACGVPQVAGRSGGSTDAVVHDRTGVVIDDPRDVGAVSRAIADLLDDEPRRARLAAASRQRAEEHFTYDRLARDLDAALAALE